MLDEKFGKEGWAWRIIAPQTELPEGLILAQQQPVRFLPSTTEHVSVLRGLVLVSFEHSEDSGSKDDDSEDDDSEDDDSEDTDSEHSGNDNSEENDSEHGEEINGEDHDNEHGNDGDSEEIDSEDTEHGEENNSKNNDSEPGQLRLPTIDVTDALDGMRYTRHIGGTPAPTQAEDQPAEASNSSEPSEHTTARAESVLKELFNSTSCPYEAALSGLLLWSLGHERVPTDVFKVDIALSRTVGFALQELLWEHPIHGSFLTMQLKNFIWWGTKGAFNWQLSSDAYGYKGSGSRSIVAPDPNFPPKNDAGGTN